MKSRILKSLITVFFSTFSIAWLITSCNNSDQTENTSVSDSLVTQTPMNDTTVNITTPINDTSSKSNNMVDGKNATGTTVRNKRVRITTTMMTADANAKMETDKMGYYSNTEVAPVYPGGQSSLEDYINNHIDYPQEAIDNNAEGTVRIQFAIDENGKVSNAKVNGAKLGHGLDEAAVKVVSQMPQWTPGMVKGKKVKAWYTLPITYKLE